MSLKHKKAKNKKRFYSSKTRNALICVVLFSCLGIIGISFLWMSGNSDLLIIFSIFLLPLISLAIWSIYAIVKSGRLYVPIELESVDEMNSEINFGDPGDLAPERKETAIELIRYVRDTNNSAAVFATYGIGKSDFFSRMVNMATNDKRYSQTDIYKININLIDDYNDPTAMILREMIRLKLITNRTINEISKVDYEIAPSIFRVNKTQLKSKFEDIDFWNRIFKLLSTDLYLHPEEAKSPNIIFIIDEMDRAKPSYILKLLESIEYVFSRLESLSFIYSMSEKHMEEIIKNYYGIDDFKNYLDKFVGSTFTLENVNLLNIMRSFKNLDKGLCNKVQKIVIKEGLQLENIRKSNAFIAVLSDNAKEIMAYEDTFSDEIIRILYAKQLSEASQNKYLKNRALLMKMNQITYKEILVSNIQNHNFSRANKKLISMAIRFGSPDLKMGNYHLVLNSLEKMYKWKDHMFDTELIPEAFIQTFLDSDTYKNAIKSMEVTLKGYSGDIKKELRNSRIYYDQETNSQIIENIRRYYE